MSRMRKLNVKPNLDQFNKKLFNLTVLQRVDPSIDEIIFTTAQVTIYQFDIDSFQWGRKDVDGSLFVVKRNSYPHFQFIVMNRRSPENLVENLVGDFEFEVKPPYILYKNESSEVNGIWFYNSRDSDEFAKLLTRILDPYSKVNPKPQITSTNSEFEELEKVPTMAVMDGPLEPVSATNARTDTVDESAFMNFFSAAMKIRSKPSTPMNLKDNCQATPSTPSYSFSVSPTSNIVQSQPIIYSPPTSLPLHGPVSTIRNSHNVTNLVKPSLFFQPPLTSRSPMTPSPLSAACPISFSAKNSQLNSVPSVLPFPPPTLQVSPASNSNSRSYGRDFDREKVRNALLSLAKDEQFINIVYQALLKSHNS